MISFRRMSAVEFLEHAGKLVHELERVVDRLLDSIDRFGTTRFVLLVLAGTLGVLAVNWWLRHGLLGGTVGALGRLWARAGRRRA